MAKRKFIDIDSEDEPFSEPIKTQKTTQVLELPNTSDWFDSRDFGSKVDEVFNKYKLKSMTIIRDRNVIIEIIREV